MLVLLLLTLSMISCEPGLEPGKYDFIVDDVRLRIVDSEDIYYIDDFICVYSDYTEFPQYTCFEKERVEIKLSTDSHLPGN